MGTTRGIIPRNNTDYANKENHLKKRASDRAFSALGWGIPLALAFSRRAKADCQEFLEFTVLR
jgi:hypothetical protein